MKKNSFIVIILFLLLCSLVIYYYESNKLIDCSKRECINTFPLNNNENKDVKEISGNIENQFHISSVADSNSIKITYEPIEELSISWPVDVDYKVYENQNLIKQGNYNYTQNQEPISIDIKRKEDKEYKIVSEIIDKNSKIVNKSSLIINRLDDIKGDFPETKETLSFDQEVDYIKNNIDEIVSDFEKEPANGNWYVVDIRFTNNGDKVAVLEGGEKKYFSDAIVIFEDGHYSYLTKLEKVDNQYKAVSYYNFIQRPKQKVGWREIGTDNYLDVGEVIYQWSIEQ